MKNLMLCMSGMLLAIQVNAQQVSINSNTSTNANTSTSYAYTVNGVKNQVNVKYSSNMQELQDDSPVKTKSFTKSFGIDRSDKITLSNQFGSMTIKTWDKNEIKVDAEIKAYAKTEDEAQKLLDQVSIGATKDGDLVSYKTNMGDRNGNWGTNVRNGKVIWRREVKIHMTVYMPASNALTASQTYGPLTIEDFAGPTSLKVQYGNLTTGNLSNSNNYISVQYGKANLKDVNAAKIKHQYGDGVTINSIGTLDINAQYTSVNIGTVKGNAQITHQYGNGVTIGTVGGSLDANAQYTAITVTTIKGNATISQQYGRGVTIGSVGNLNINAQYAGVKVDNLRGNLTTKMQNGRLDIDNVEASGKIINVNTAYTNVVIGFDQNYGGDLDVSTNYCDFKYGGNVSAKKLGEDRGYSSVKNYSGQVGKGGAGKINVRADYGSVTLK